MNNKFKKGALALGTIATIAAPVAAVVSCGTVNTIYYDAKGNYQPGISWEDFIKSLDGMGLKDKSLLNKGEYQASGIFYDQEVKASINSQIDSFAYEYYQKGNDLTDLNDLTAGLESKKAIADKGTIQADKDSTKAALDAHNKKINDLKEEIKKLETKLGELVKLGSGQSSEIKYDSNTLSSDYPLLLLPTENIAKEKQSYLDDAKENFITQFATRSEGQGKWPEERSSKFNGATSDSEAVDYLVNQSISSKAMGKFKFEVNSSYNLEQYIYAKTMEDGTFSFLNSDESLVAYNETTENKTSVDNVIGAIKAATDSDAKIKILHDWVKTNPTKAASKVFFLSSQSENKVWWSDFTNDLINPSNIIEVKHALIGIKRGADDKDPWEAAQADVLKLLTTIKDGSGSIIGYDAITDPKLFSDDDFTSASLKNFVTADGSVANGGSLGFNSVLGYVKSMVEGFGLGVLEKSSGKSINDGAHVIANFKKQMGDALTEALKAIGVDKAKFDKKGISDKNEDVKRALTYMGDDKIKTVFGSIFRDTFGSTKHLVSDFGSNSFVVSSFGVHIINQNDKTGIKDALRVDLESLAKAEYTTSKTGITTLINNHFTQIVILKSLLTNSDFEAKFKAGIKKDDKNADEDQAWTDFGILVAQTLKAQGEQELQTAIGTKISTWYVGQINSGILDVKTLSPSDLYALAEAKKGAN